MRSTGLAAPTCKPPSLPCRPSERKGDLDLVARWEPSRTSGGRRSIGTVITIVEAAQRVGRSPGTVRRWIREGRLRAETVRGRLMIDAGAIDEVRDEMYPMLPLPPEWQKLEDGSPAPNWVAGVALSRLGR